MYKMCPSTSIAFLVTNCRLALEKDKDIVQRIVNGVIVPKPLLDVNVAAILHDREC
jgi:hypothetical protein